MLNRAERDIHLVKVKRMRHRTFRYRRGDIGGGGGVTIQNIGNKGRLFGVGQATRPFHERDLAESEEVFA